jgi:predicted secreted protein
VPGIRYVVDPGFARISRFSQRLKVQRLPIEEVSQNVDRSSIPLDPLITRYINFPRRVSEAMNALVIQLAENPTTGYSWNATVTSGLTIIDDAYEPYPQSRGMVGAGGTHFWILSGTAAGEQKFSAIYMRPWENVTGSEDTFVLNVLVEKV